MSTAHGDDGGDGDDDNVLEEEIKFYRKEK